MAQPKERVGNAEKLEKFASSVQSLATGAPTDMPMVLGELLGHRIDRIRVFEHGAHSTKMIREFALTKLPRHGAKTRPVAKKRVLDPQLAQMLQEVDDPEIAINFTMDMESGNISLAIETESVLEGQDLSKLVSGSSNEALPVFEDEPFGDEFWSADDAAKHFGVAKSTITRRIKSGDLIGFRLFKNELYIPREQVTGQTLVNGIKDILAMFDASHREAWRFLSSAVFYGDSDPRPIDRLLAASSNEQLKACLDELQTAKAGFEYGDHV